MAITNKEVLHLAKLARLDVSEDEIADLQKKLSDIIGYIDSLKELQSSEAPRETSNLITTPERQDIVAPSLPIDLVMENAPAKMGSAFQVPRIIEANH